MLLLATNKIDILVQNWTINEVVEYVDPIYNRFSIYTHPIVPVYVTTGNLLPSLNIYDHSNNLCGILSQIRRKVENTHRNRY